MKPILQYTILLVILVGCKEHSTETAALSQYELWRSYNTHDYTIEQIRVCYCIYGGERMKVSVKSDTVYSVMRLVDSVFIPYPAAKFYVTIDSLFGILHTPSTDSLVVTYNSRYGFPETLDINPQLHPVDGGVLYETYNFQRGTVLLLTKGCSQ